MTIVPDDDHSKHLRAFFGAERVRDPYPAPSVIVPFTNRCGSTYLCAVLSQLGFVPTRTGNDFELFYHEVVIDECRALGFRSFGEYAPHLVSNNLSSRGWFGCKASPAQTQFLLDTGFLGRMLVDPVFVQIRRCDVVAQAVSMVIAMKTGQWSSVHPRCLSPPEFDFDMIRQARDYIHEGEDSIKALYEAHGIKPLVIWYEDVADDPQTLVSRLGRRLDIDPNHKLEALPIQRQAKRLNTDWELRFRAMEASPGTRT